MLPLTTGDYSGDQATNEVIPRVSGWNLHQRLDRLWYAIARFLQEKEICFVI